MWTHCSGSPQIPVFIFIIFLSTFWYPISSDEGFLSLSSFIPETVSSLLCCYSTPESSGSPFKRSLYSHSCLRTTKKISIFFCLRGNFILSSAVFSHLSFVSCSLCLSHSSPSLWGTVLFLRSQVVNKGGIQFLERSLIGWFGKFGWFSYPLSLSLSFFSLFFALSRGVSQLPPSWHYRLFGNEKIIFISCVLSLTPVSFFLCYPFRLT